MGKKCPCEDLKLPPVPLVEHCVAHGDGTCTYYDEAGNPHRVIDRNKVCRDAMDDAALFNWIHWVESNAK